MNPRLSPRRRQRASTLVMVLVLSACTLVILGGVLGWTTTNTTLTGRNNEYFRTAAAAEAATEKVLAAMTYEYQASGDATVRNNISNYKTKYPLASENPVWGDYQFSDGNGTANRTHVEYIPPSEFRVLTAQYRGLYGYSSVFRVISNARDTRSRYNITAGVWQDVETATIPLFQFAIFYNLDLEINPGPAMTVNGPVHSNQKIYLRPGDTLTFNDDITAAGEVFNTRKPGDPVGPASGTVVFNGEKDSGVSSLNLPIGTDNTPASVRKVIEVPPSGESATSPLGLQRMYNKADVIVTVSDAGVSVKSGLVNNFATTVNLPPVGSAAYSTHNWVTTSQLYNRREAKTVKTVEIDVANLLRWSASASNNLPYRAGTTSREVTIIHVDDQRTSSTSSGNQPGVVVKNGKALPPSGLTVVTPDPLYVRGHYNVRSTPLTPMTLGSSDTSMTRPAALMGDSINILSETWDLSNTAYGSRAFSDRVAVPTTVNAAILAGIVETVSGSYSGGVENFPRFLEDWNGVKFTYNGSMVVMFPSQVATGLWQGTGSGIGIYNPPVRHWSFDLNFRDPAKIPPGTPSVRVLIRGAWAMVKPGTTNIVNPNEILP
jgi:hypothetical protein